MMKYTIVICIMAIAVMFCIGCVDSSKYPQTVVERVNISSLDRDITVQGHFFLGSGSINSKPVYFYYVQLPNGGYKLKSVESSQCTIFMDENESPYISANYYYDSGLIGTAESRDIGRTYIVRKYPVTEGDTEKFDYIVYHIEGDVEIHIPQGSIVKQYNP